MKKWLHAALVCLIGTGCFSISKQDKQESAYALINAAAHSGTAIYLLEKDEEKRGQAARTFEAVARGLEVLETKENLTIQDIAKIVYTLPIKELRSKEAVIAISAAQLALRDLQVGADTSLEKFQLRRVARELHTGIRSGMFAVIGVTD